jgi:hypothetical protein
MISCNGMQSYVRDFSRLLWLDTDNLIFESQNEIFHGNT